MKLRSGSGGGTTSTTTHTTEQDRTDTQTTSTDSSESYNDTIDLGNDTTGGNTYDLENNAAAAVTTSDEIADAGGPEAVLVDEQEEVTEVNKAVSEVSQTLEESSSDQNDQTKTSNVPKEVTARRNAANQNVAPREPTASRGFLGQLLAAFARVLEAVFPGGN